MWTGAAMSSTMSRNGIAKFAWIAANELHRVDHEKKPLAAGRVVCRVPRYSRFDPGTAGADQGGRAQVRRGPQGSSTGVHPGRTRNPGEDAAGARATEVRQSRTSRAARWQRH